MTIKASDNGLKRVYVEGDKFKVDGKDLWINGTNTPGTSGMTLVVTLIVTGGIAILPS